MSHPRPTLFGLAGIAGIAGLAAGLGLCAPAPAQGHKGVLKRGVYVDEVHGYSVKVPPKWKEVPTQVDEKWIVAQFQSNREYEGHHALDNSAFHRPVMRVIMFDEEVIKKTVYKEEAGDTKVTKIKLPYRDYRDYVHRNLNKGGYFFSKEEENGKMGKLAVSRYEVKVEKLTRTGRKQYIAWVYKGQGVDFAVEFEFLLHHFKKHKKFAMTPLKSFKFIPRKGGVVEEKLVSTSDWQRSDWKKLKPRERHDKRRAIAEQRIKKAINSLPQGWIVKETKNFVILSHASKKYTTRVLKSVECCRAWLEDRFGSVTPEYVTRGIVRVCKNSEEFSLYLTGSNDAFNADDREVVDYEDKGAGTTGGGQGNLLYGLYNQYLYDKDEYLYEHAPAWVKYAYSDYLAYAQLKGRSLVFKKTQYELSAFREMRRKSITPLTVKELIGLYYEPLLKGENGGKYYYAQCLRFLRYLEGPGKKQKLLKGQDFITRYMKETIVQAEDYIDKHPNVRRNDADTEAEEEEQASESNKYGVTLRKEVCANINKAVCKWSDADAKALQADFERYCKRN